MRVLDMAPYTPFADPRMARLPGLMPMSVSDWFVLHEDFADQMTEREELLANRRDAVLRLLPEGETAARELMEAVAADVSARACYVVGGVGITRPDGVSVTLDTDDPLATAGRLVAEDLCILMPDKGSGEYKLAGAIVCFPSRWSLAEKIGRPLTVIHDPVPDYGPDLARRVNRVFSALGAGRPIVRFNWLVQASIDLFLPTSIAAELDRRPVGSSSPLYLRTERQTLTRLPASGAVVFAIKTSLSELDTLTPDQASALHSALLEFDAQTIAYKSSDCYTEAIDRLAGIACQMDGAAPSSGIN